MFTVHMCTHLCVYILYRHACNCVHECMLLNVFGALMYQVYMLYTVVLSM